ncbi:hypothetical protein Bbelb_000450 [Branchiostoma belcheri]|nr:hypothetical protein Bbelb_000450 [Branchiostoma belcheri]
MSVAMPEAYIKSNCNQTTDADSGEAGYIEWSSVTRNSAESCSLTLNAPVGSMFRLKFTRFDLDRNGQACVDTINILDGPNMLSMSKTGGDTCTQPSGEITTISNTVTISFTQGSTDIDFMKFKLQYSVYRMSVLGMCTSSSDFKCDNNRCIKQDNTCDLRDDCGDNSDESSSDSGANCLDLKDVGGAITNFLSLGLAAIIGIVVGVIVLIILIIVLICVCCCNCCRKGNNQAV